MSTYSEPGQYGAISSIPPTWKRISRSYLTTSKCQAAHTFGHHMCLMEGSAARTMSTIVLYASTNSADPPA